MLHSQAIKFTKNLKSKEGKMTSNTANALDTLGRATPDTAILNAITLDECKPNHCYKITSIHFTNQAIKERLASFGVVRGALCTILCAAPNKATLSIQVNQTLVALRGEEAKLIFVEPIHR